jgi:hypothetical protein
MIIKMINCGRFYRINISGETGLVNLLRVHFLDNKRLGFNLISYFIRKNKI